MQCFVNLQDLPALGLEFPCHFLQGRNTAVQGMTTANKITIFRILLIPFFVVQVLYYVKNGNELHRLLAICSFAAAAICDGGDGYIAGRYKQRSELGAILDPLADKLLLVLGVGVLSFEEQLYLVIMLLWLLGIV